MAYEQKNNSGSLFKNDRKEKDTHPDYTGTGLIDGKEYWISAWLKSGQKGKFFSFAFKEKEAKAKPKPDPISTGRRNADMDDEIPF